MTYKKDTERSFEQIQKLIDSYRNGEDAAITKLHTLLEKPINQSCAKALAGDDAADLLIANYNFAVPDMEADVWEAILKLLNSKEPYPLSKEPVPYVRGIARNITKSFTRRIRSRQTNGGSSTPNNFESYDLVLGEEPKSYSLEGPTLDETTHRASVMDSLLDRLSPIEEKVYALTIEGHNQNQIAENLDISLRSVKGHKKAIVDKLGAYIQRNELEI